MQKSYQADKFKIKALSPRFVAEVSSNHNHDLDRCLKFIDVSAEIGCSAVKFQLFKLNKLFAPEIIARNKDIRKRENWELPLEFIPALSKHCRSKNIKFSCTPFYLDAVKELLPYVNFYKISSYDLLRNNLLAACAKTKKPVVLSTGMATIDEVQAGVDVLTDNGCRDITILQCISGYPTPVKQCNLSAIEIMKRSIKVKNDVNLEFGWSDHSVNEAVILRAIYRWDAKMVEFHFDLDGKGAEFGGGHCWLPENVSRLIKMVKDGFSADGDGKKEPQKIELDERNWRADHSDGLRPLKKTREKLR